MNTNNTTTVSNDIPEHLKNQLKLEDLDYTEATFQKKYNGFYNKCGKRCMDFILALCLFVLLLPVYLIVGACVAIESGFPVIYRAERGGYKGKTFKIFKFRTMVKNADKIGGGTTALNDSRITKVGSLLRKTKLDETAQIFNILSGTMSFIGPRPELLSYIEQYDELEKNILNVRPGITDFSSLYLINLDEIVGNQNADEIYEKYVFKKKNQLRMKYVAELSFATDCKLFFKTILRVLKKAFRVIFRIRKKSDYIIESIK